MSSLLSFSSAKSFSSSKEVKFSNIIGIILFGSIIFFSVSSFIVIVFFDINLDTAPLNNLSSLFINLMNCFILYL